MYQVVIDTNVLVAALLSNRGASHRLLRLVGDDRWRMNLSVPLVLEFAGAERFGIRVIAPREFLAIIGEAP
jgi:predicted nucleic acid-binding protein